MAATNATLKQFIGGQWVPVVVGSRGAQGATGANSTVPGPQGYQGASITGAQGSQGPQGFQGPSGSAGVQAWAQALTKPAYTAAEVGAPSGSGTSSGTNTGDQTSVSGNAGTATKLATARLIGGANFDGSVDVAPKYLVGYGDQTVNAANRVVNGPGSGLFTYGYYSSAGPSSYGEIISFGSGVGGQAEIAVSWSGTPGMWVRSLRDTTDNWTAWASVITSLNIGSQSVSYAATAGSAPASDVSAWAKAATKPTYAYSEVGAAAAGHTHSYQAADGDLLAIAGLIGNSGYLKKTGVDTWTLDTSTFATGTGTASGTNTGDETLATIKTKLGITILSGDNTGDQTTITGNAGTATALSAGADRTKLDGIAAGANNYAHPANHPPSVITQDASNRFVTDAEKATWNAKQPSGTYATGTGTASGTNTGDQVIPTTLPASDVYAWAKTATKPTYTYSEVGAQVAGTYATGTGSASGTNTGDETLATIKAKLGITTLSGVNTGDQTTITGNAGTATTLQTARTINGISFNGSANITINAVDSTTREASIAAGTTAQYWRGDKSWQTLPTTLPASDVSAWAKAATKPTYTAAEVGSDAAGTARPASDVYSWAKAATKPSYTAAEVGLGSTATPSFAAVDARRLAINRGATAASGISWYSSGYTAWCDYMAPGGTTAQGPYGTITTPAGTIVTGWALRSFVEDVAGYGWTWEASNSSGQPAIVAELSSNTGNFKTKGTVTGSNLSGTNTGDQSLASLGIADYTYGAYTVKSDVGSSTWYHRADGHFVWGRAYDWSQSFALNLSDGASSIGTGWATFGQRQSNNANGTWRGTRFVKYAGSAMVDGDVRAGAYYLGGNDSRLTIGGGGSLALTNQYGNIEIGPMNSGTCHIYTTMPSFYFNKELLVLGNSVIHSGTIGTQSVSSATSASNVYQGTDPTAGTYRLLLGNGTNAIGAVSNFSSLYFNSSTATILGANISGGASTSTELLSKYPYNTNVISDATTAVALSPGVGSTTVAMHASHGYFGGYATTLTMSGYERYGATQISANYNVATPALAIRNYNQTLGTWNSWQAILTSANWSSWCAAATHTHDYTAVTSLPTNALRVNSPWSTRLTQGAPYQTGTMGWGATDFNVMLSSWGSGFIEAWGSPANAPPGGLSGHYTGVQAMHYGHQNGTQGYGWQMVSATESTNRFFLRNSWPTPQAWVEMIHGGNIGSQSVNYASSAGSAPANGGTSAACSGNAATATAFPTCYVGGVQTNPQVYFGSSVGLRVAMTGFPNTWSDTLWINGYSGADVPNMCALHTIRNGQPRMWISSQHFSATAYGAAYEFITGFNIGSQSVAAATSATNVTGTAGTLGYSQGGPVSYGGTGGPQVMGNTSQAAMLSFHRAGAYAVNFGLDNDNILKVGGWSMGAVSYAIMHAGNIGSQSVNYASSAGSAPANGGTSAACSGNAENLTTPSGYKHVGTWGGGGTSAGSILVNYAYYSVTAAACTGNAATSSSCSGNAATATNVSGYQDVAANRLYDHYTGGAMYNYNGRIYNGWLNDTVSVNYANSAGNGGVTSVNGQTGAVTVATGAPTVSAGTNWQDAGTFSTGSVIGNGTTTGLVGFARIYATGSVRFTLNSGYIPGNWYLVLYKNGVAISSEYLFNTANPTIIQDVSVVPGDYIQMTARNASGGAYLLNPSGKVGTAALAPRLVVSTAA